MVTFSYYLHGSHMGICCEFSSKFFISSPKEDYWNYDILSLCGSHRPHIYSSAILPFDKICIDRIGITMFKVKYELLPKSVTQMFSKNKDIHSHDTRNKNLLRVSTGTKNITLFLC